MLVNCNLKKTKTGEKHFICNALKKTTYMQVLHFEEYYLLIIYGWNQ